MEPGSMKTSAAINVSIIFSKPEQVATAEQFEFKSKFELILYL